MIVVRDKINAFAGSAFSNWKLLIELQFRESDLPCSDLCAVSIAHAVKILQSQGIFVAICLTSEHGKHCPPEQHVLQLLAPCLQACDLYSTSHIGPQPYSTSCFSETHLKALSSAGSRLEKISFSDQAFDVQYMPIYNVVPIAAFSKLQKLHLTCDILDFWPLASLKCLQDLAIQHVGPAAAVVLNCSDVIESSRHSLLCVRLVAYQWGLHTYRALSSVKNLHTLVVRVTFLGWLGFGSSSCLTALDFVELVIKRPRWLDFIAVSVLLGKCITSLMLCRLQSVDACCLSTVLQLKQLCIIHSDLTGSELRLQPGLTSSRLINCSSITDQGLLNTTTALPNLKELAIQRKQNAGTPGNISAISREGLMALCFGRNLEDICLDIEDSLNREDIQALKEGIEAQQQIGLMKPKVSLLLPGRPTILMNYNLHKCEVLHCLPAPMHCRTSYRITPNKHADKMKHAVIVAASIIGGFLTFARRSCSSPQTRFW